MIGIKSIGRTHRRMSAMVGLFLFLVVMLGAIAQGSTVTILGVVKDSSGAVLPYATLTASNVDTGQTRITATTEDGSYRFSDMAVGTFEIQVEYPGFRSEVRRGLTFTVSQEAVVNITLEAEAVVQKVRVTAEAPLVNITTGSLGSLLAKQSVADLPIRNRGLINLTLPQTAVQESKNGNLGAETSETWSSSQGDQSPSNHFLGGLIIFSSLTPSSILRGAYDSDMTVGLYVQDDLQSKSLLRINQYALKITF